MMSSTVRGEAQDVVIIKRQKMLLLADFDRTALLVQQLVVGVSFLGVARYKAPVVGKEANTSEEARFLWSGLWLFILH